MIQIPVPEALTFDDVLLVPAYSDVVPAQVSTQTLLTRSITLNTPLLSAAMDTVTESRLAIAMAQQGGMGVVHRNLTIEQQAGEIVTVKDIQKKLKYPNAAKDSQGRLRVAGAIGATGDFLERAAELVAARVDALAIDSAHGHSSRVLEAVATVKKRFPQIDLLAGNIATYEGAI